MRRSAFAYDFLNAVVSLYVAPVMRDSNCSVCFCLCRMSKKEKHLDIDPCEKDDPEEDDHEAGVSATEAALAAENKKLKAQLEAANAALKAAPSPIGRAKYDHETTKKNLVKNTAPVRELMEKLQDDYEAVYYMWSLCDYWKSLIPQDRTMINAHNAFMKHFRKVRHLYGLPEKNVADALGDLTINEDEDAGAGAD